jgi:hypothetical protein
LQQPFFFRVAPAAPLLLYGAKLTDFFVDADQVLTELLEAMKFGDLLLRFAKCGWIGKGLCHGLACHSSSQAELGIMARIIWFGAMAGKFTTAPDHGSNRTGPKITQAEELLQELGSIGLQGSESIRHSGFLSERIDTLRIMA